MYTIGPIENFTEQKSYPFTVGKERYLLVHSGETYYLIANHCGHFGVSLENGFVENDIITCPVHGITFNLETGEKVNRPYEICDKLITLQLIEKDGVFLFDPESASHSDHTL